MYFLLKSPQYLTIFRLTMIIMSLYLEVQQFSSIFEREGVPNLFLAQVALGSSYLQVNYDNIEIGSRSIIVLWCLRKRENVCQICSLIKLLLLRFHELFIFRLIMIMMRLDLKARTTVLQCLRKRRCTKLFSCSSRLRIFSTLG